MQLKIPLDVRSSNILFGWIGYVFPSNAMIIKYIFIEWAGKGSLVKRPQRLML